MKMGETSEVDETLHGESLLLGFQQELCETYLHLTTGAVMVRKADLSKSFLLVGP